jgi:hypothetical protein
MEHSTATLASLKVLLRKSPTLQTLHRSLRTSQLHGPSEERSGRYGALLASQQYRPLSAARLLEGHYRAQLIVFLTHLEIPSF